jgi:hypothetical protein
MSGITVTAPDGTLLEGIVVEDSARNDAVTLLVPPLAQDGYYHVRLLSTYGGEGSLKLSLFSTITNPCHKRGEYMSTPSDPAASLFCLPCPDGAFCPGGGRMWPMAGYWSENEFAVATLCHTRIACPGVNRTAESTPVAIYPKQEITTANCNPGYGGAHCAFCEPRFFAFDELCLACGDEREDSTKFISAVIIVTLLFLAFGGAVTLLPSHHLGVLVGVTLFLQQVSLIIIDILKISIALSKS